jgi:DNA repair protein RecO (recombination protein O)
MLVKTRAVFLQLTPFNEKTSIVKLFTENFGTVTFSVNGIYRSKKLKKSIFFQPLSLLDIVYENKEKKNIQYLKEVRFDYPFSSANTDIFKTSILFFLNEVLIASLREQEANAELYSFLHNTLQYLDVCQENTSNFHLLFLLKFSAYLGFAPENISKQNDSFNLPDKLVNFYACSFSNMNKFTFSNIERKEALNTIINYYKFHLPGFKEVKSTAILEELFI